MRQRKHPSVLRPFIQCGVPGVSTQVASANQVAFSVLQIKLGVRQDSQVGSGSLDLSVCLCSGGAGQGGVHG